MKLLVALCLVGTVGLAAPRAGAQTAVNLYATVRSADGYLNARDAPSSARGGVVTRVRNGERVPVASCAAGRRGRRWCEVRRAATETGRSGMPEFASSAELAYLRAAAPAGDTAAGVGVARGFVPVVAEGLVGSADGYLNLRAGPAASQRVLQRLTNGAYVQMLACSRRREGARWCLVEASDDPELQFGPVGYVYDAEVTYPGHE